jgi:hypothetical protein
MAIGIQKWSCAGFLHTRIDLYKDGNKTVICSLTFAKRGAAGPKSRTVYILF